MMNDVIKLWEIIMYRTIISLDEEDRDWLKHTSEINKISMSEIVRQALASYRQQEEKKQLTTLNQLLDDAAEGWNGEDGLVWQGNMRKEWDSR